MLAECPDLWSGMKTSYLNKNFSLHGSSELCSESFTKKNGKEKIHITKEANFQIPNEL